MSINPEHPTKPSNLPPYPHTKEDTVIPPPEHRDDKHEKKSKKGAVMIGGAVLATIATVGSVFGLSSGNNERAAGPTKEPTVSAPVETENLQSFDFENSFITVDNFPSYMLQPDSDAQGVIDNFDSVVSLIVNQRVSAGNEGVNGSELQLLGNLNVINPELEEFVALIQVNFEIGQDAWQEQGRGEDIRLAFKSIITSVDPTPDGGYIINTEDQYWALDSNDEFVGYALSNIEKRQYKFDQGAITLPTNEVLETFVFSDVKNLG